MFERALHRPTSACLVLHFHLLWDDDWLCADELRSLPMCLKGEACKLHIHITLNACVAMRTLSCAKCPIGTITRESPSPSSKRKLLFRRGPQGCCCSYLRHNSVISNTPTETSNPTIDFSGIAHLRICLGFHLGDSLGVVLEFRRLVLSTIEPLIFACKHPTSGCSIERECNRLVFVPDIGRDGLKE